MTFVVDGTNGLTFPNSTTQASAGKVLQVVQGTLTTAFSTTNTSFTDIGLSASITPSSSNSKVLVVVHLNGVHSSDSGYNVYYTIIRGATNITNVSAAGNGWSIRAGQTSGRWGSDSITYLDSPATTSSTTYKIQIASEGGGRTAYVSEANSYNALSTITVMEIAA